MNDFNPETDCLNISKLAALQMRFDRQDLQQEALADGIASMIYNGEGTQNTVAVCHGSNRIILLSGL